MDKKRFEHIDFLRAFSIIGVLAVHTLFYNLNNPANIFIWNILEFVVVGFVFCSGFVSAAFYTDTLKTWKYTFGWYKKRLLRLLIPFWIYLVIHYSLWILFPNFFQGLGIEKSWSFFIQSFLLIGGIGINWLPLLFLELTLLFPILLKIIKNNKTLWIYGAVGLLVTAWFTVQPFPNSYYKFVMWVPWSLVFLLSIMLFKKESLIRYGTWIGSGIVVFILSFLYMQNLHLPLNMIEHKYPPDLYYLSYSIAATLLVLIVGSFGFWKTNFLRKTVQFISTNSYQLFFIEYIILDVVLLLAKRGLLISNAGLEFLIVLFLSILISYSISVWNLILKKNWKFLMSYFKKGRRSPKKD